MLLKEIALQLTEKNPMITSETSHGDARLKAILMLFFWWSDSRIPKKMGGFHPK